MRLVIFDVDGTLTQMDGPDRFFVEALVEDMGIAEPNTDWGSYSAVTDSTIAIEALRAHHQRLPTARELQRLEDGVYQRLEAAIAADADLVRPTPGALALIAALEADPHRHFVIATGGWERVQRLKLEAAGFDLDGVVAAWAEDGLTRDQIVDVAGERGRYRYQQPFEGSILVGDAVWDVQTAALMDIPFLGLASGAKAAALRAAGAQHVLTDFQPPARVLAALDLALPPRPGFDQG